MRESNDGGVIIHSFIRLNNDSYFLTVFLKMGIKEWVEILESLCVVSVLSLFGQMKLTVYRRLIN